MWRMYSNTLLPLNHWSQCPDPWCARSSYCISLEFKPPEASTCASTDTSPSPVPHLKPPSFMVHQVIVFDLEFGQPAASTTLPKSRPAFRNVLGAFGHRGAGQGLHDGGVDLLYLSHQARTVIRSCHVSRSPLELPSASTQTNLTPAKLRPALRDAPGAFGHSGA